MAVNEDFPLALCSGTVLAGQYVIEKVLGQGGFGITYKASDHKTGEKVAVKEFFPDSLAYRESTQVISYPGERDENFQYGKESFLQEAQTLAQFIGNKNIVHIHSYFEENGTAYFVMDYIEGTSFDEYLRQNDGKISVIETEKILIPIMDALEAVHAKGIVHRDVTPDNIYICSDGTVKLLDFGAARYSLGDKSKSLDIILKHGFAPKEQYTRHGRQGPYTDIYSLAATFYFAITGRRPPDSIDRLDEDDLIPPSSLGVDITDYQERALYMALEVQPQNRFASMSAFKNVLLNENPGQAQAIAGYAASTIPTAGSTISAETTTGNTFGVSTESKPFTAKQKKFSGKKIAIASAAAVAVVGIGTAILIPSLNKKDNDSSRNKKNSSAVEAFVDDPDVKDPDVTKAPPELNTNILTTTKVIITTKAITTAKATTTAKPQTTTTTKTQPVTTAPPASSGSLEVLGSKNGNLVNNGIICWDGNDMYYIDDNWHSINKESSGNITELFYNENMILGNLCHFDNTLYFLYDGKAAYLEDGASDAHQIDALADYENIQRMYITEDYYYIYVSKSEGDGNLCRISRSGKFLDSLPIDYANNFTISGGYIYYTGISDTGKNGIFKKPADDLSETGYGLIYDNMIPNYPVVDNGYLYVICNDNDGKICEICRYDAPAMKLETEKIYDVSDLITNGTGYISQLNVKDNNMFFTFSDSNNNYIPYHFIINGENARKECMETVEVYYPNIVSYKNGDIKIYYMRLDENSVYNLYYMRYNSEGSRIE